MVDPRSTEDNLVCRHLHVPMLPLRPSVHCPYINPTGGDMCIARDYRQVVEASRCPNGWIAPKVLTPENAKEISHLQTGSGSDLDPLLGKSDLSRNDSC